MGTLDGAWPVAVALLLVPPILIVTAVTLLLRTWRDGSLRDRLAYLVLLPARRRRAVSLFAGMALSFLGAGTVGLLAMLVALDPAGIDLASSLLFVAGSAALLGLLLVALHGPPLTLHERLLLDGTEPLVYSVGLVDRHTPLSPTGASPGELRRLPRV